MGVRTGAKRHTHRYHKVQGLWHCSLSDCTHFMPLNVAHNVIGKLSLCWNCGLEFALDEDNMKSDKPICLDCTMKGAGFDPVKAMEYISQKSIELRNSKPVESEPIIKPVVEDWHEE